MKQHRNKIAFGGGCYWCLEAVYQSLRGVRWVEQGFIAPDTASGLFSEAVIVHYNPTEISQESLIEIHLHTHKSTSNHSRRSKYRSAVYTFSEEQNQQAGNILRMFQEDFEDRLITKAYLFNAFKPSEVEFHNYYYSNPEKPFCKRFIEPKLRLLLHRFKRLVNEERLTAGI